MATLHKFFELFKNLKSDAVPRPPRPNKEKAKTEEPQEENNENMDSSNKPDPNILVESDDDEDQSEKKPKFKKSFFKRNKKEGTPGNGAKHSSSTVNTQATGNVINVVNSQNVRWGNDYYMGPTYRSPPPKHFKNEEEESDPEEDVKMCNTIKLVLESKIKPEHEYIDHISKNLGRSWQRFFRNLGYSKNKIDTMIIDTEKYGVSEARYRLLLDWINNEDDPSLGRLATLLWEYGERRLVNELALKYKQNKN